MREYFYRVKNLRDNTYYTGQKIEHILKTYVYDDKKTYYTVGVVVDTNWSSNSFWSCKRFSTLKNHIKDICRTKNLTLADLEIQKCYIGRIEVVEIDFIVV